MHIRWQILSIASNEVNVLVRPDSYLTLHYRITLASGPGKDSVFADTFDGRPGTLQMGSGQWALNKTEPQRHANFYLVPVHRAAGPH